MARWGGSLHCVSAESPGNMTHLDLEMGCGWRKPNCKCGWFVGRCR